MNEPVEVFIDGTAAEIGSAGLRCMKCETLVPLPVYVKVAPDEDGDNCLYTFASTIELESHQLTHMYGADTEGSAVTGVDDPE